MGDTPSVLVFNDKDDFNSNVLNSAFSSVDLRLRAVEGLNASYEDAINTLNQYGLQRLNDAMQPVYDQLVKISQIGVIFTTTSQTPALIAQGPATFIVTAGTARTQFAAAAFLQVRSKADASLAMYGSTESYDATTGELKLLITETSGTSTTAISDWVISAAATPDLLTKAHDIGAYTMQEVNDLIAHATGNIDLSTLMPLAGGTMTGDLTLAKGMLKLGTGQGTGAKNWNFTSSTTGSFVAGLSDGTNQFVFGSDGSLKVPGLNGDLKTYIDNGVNNAAAAGTSAAAAAQTAATTAATTAASGKVAKTGDTMTGKLTLSNAALEIGGTNPYFDLVYGGVLRARWQVDGSGNMIYRNGDSGGNYFYISTAGQIWSAQFGDLWTQLASKMSGSPSTTWAGNSIAQRDGAGRCQFADCNAAGWGYVMPTGDNRIGRWVIQNGYLEVRLDGSNYAVNYTASDVRMKENIVPVVEDVESDKIDQMKFYSFDWKKDLPFEGHRSLGILAQEAMKIEPEWIIIGREDDIHQPDTYRMLMSTMKALQESNERQRKLEARLAALEAK